MTKKEFLNRLKGKKVVIDNLEQVREWSKDDDYFTRMMATHEKGLETVVRSKDLIINGCYYEIKNIVAITDKTFKSKYQAVDGLDIIYKIID